MRKTRPQTAEDAEQQIADIIDGLPPDEKTNLVLSMSVALAEIDPVTFWATALEACSRLPKKARLTLAKHFAARADQSIIRKKELEGFLKIFEILLKFADKNGKRKGRPLDPRREQRAQDIARLRDHEGRTFGEIAIAMRKCYPDLEIDYKLAETIYRRAKKG